MIKLAAKSFCCGCSACAQVCPVSCITMKADSQGFLYPIVDNAVCIKCHLCENTCPALNKTEPCRPLETFVSWNNHIETRLNSSSGGIFSLLAEVVLKKGGVVFGARFDKDWNVTHDFIETIEDIALFRGSKYVQSDLNDCYLKVKDFLRQGRKVLFSGTPCQIQGLNRFLRIISDNLLLVDVACHGVPSSLVWQSYLKYITVDRNKIKAISFRDKSTGWKEYSIHVINNEQEYKEEFFNDLYMRGFLSNLFLRPSCYNCMAKQGRSGSDITIADGWGIQNIYPELDDDKGTSLVLLNTQKGLSLYDQLNCKSYGVDYDCVVLYNPAIEKSVCRPEQYDWFWQHFPKEGCPSIESAINWKPSLIKRVFRRIMQRF